MARKFTHVAPARRLERAGVPTKDAAIILKALEPRPRAAHVEAAFTMLRRYMKETKHADLPPLESKLYAHRKKAAAVEKELLQEKRLKEKARQKERDRTMAKALPPAASALKAAGIKLVVASAPEFEVMGCVEGHWHPGKLLIRDGQTGGETYFSYFDTDLRRQCERRIWAYEIASHDLDVTPVNGGANVVEESDDDEADPDEAEEDKELLEPSNAVPLVEPPDLDPLEFLDNLAEASSKIKPPKPRQLLKKHLGIDADYMALVATGVEIELDLDTVATTPSTRHAASATPSVPRSNRDTQTTRTSSLQTNPSARFGDRVLQM